MVQVSEKPISKEKYGIICTFFKKNYSRASEMDCIVLFSSIQ